MTPGDLMLHAARAHVEDLRRGAGSRARSRPRPRPRPRSRRVRTELSALVAGLLPRRPILRVIGGRRAAPRADTAAVASAHADAAAGRPAPARAAPAPARAARASCASAVTLRLGFADDADALQRLGIRRDGRPVLLAEVCGEPRAALSLDSGTVVAHPAHGDLAELLRTRAAQLRPAGAPA